MTYRILKIPVSKSGAISINRFLNHLKLDEDDKKRVKKFFIKLRGDLGEQVLNNSDVLKRLIK